MGFLGNVASFGKRFLGHANKAVQFLGNNIGRASSALNSVSKFVSNPDVSKIEADVGIAPSYFTTVGRAADTLNSGVNLLPTIGRDLSAAGTAAYGQIQSSTKRSLADLYQQANNIV